MRHESDRAATQPSLARGSVFGDCIGAARDELRGAAHVLRRPRGGAGLRSGGSAATADPGGDLAIAGEEATK